PHRDIRTEVAAIEKQGVSLRQRSSLFRGDSFSNWEHADALTVNGTSVDLASKEFARTVREQGLYRPPFTVRLEAAALTDSAIFGLVYGWHGGERGRFIAWDMSKGALLDGHYDFGFEEGGGWTAQPVSDSNEHARGLPRGEITFAFTEDSLTVSIAG